MNSHSTPAGRSISGVPRLPHPWLGDIRPLLLALLVLAPGIIPAADSPDPVPARKAASIDTSVESDRARIAFQAEFTGQGAEADRSIHGAAIQHSIRASVDLLRHEFLIDAEAIHGGLRELVFTLAGEGGIRRVSGDGLEDWSVRQTGPDRRQLVLRLQRQEKPVHKFTARIEAETRIETPGKPIPALTLTVDPATLGHGYVRIDTTPDLTVEALQPAGVVPIEARFLPDHLRTNAPAAATLLAYRFLGTPYSLPLTVKPSDPDANRVVLRDFTLSGRLSDEEAAFTLSATAHVRNPKGASVDLLSGEIALAETTPADWRLKLERGRFRAEFDRPGTFPIRLQFGAAVRRSNDWNQIDFAVAPSTLQPVVLEGLGADTQFRFPGAARPERIGERFTSFLPASGRVRLSWKEKRAEAGGTLFFAAEGLMQIVVSPGVMRQTAALDFKVMQGELSRASLLLRGAGEITRVLGTNLLSWTVEPVAGSTDRRLQLQFNQPQRDRFAVHVQIQSTLAAFPQTVTAATLEPEGATRFGGHLRLVNDGAVRLEVIESAGLSQISPEQFPQTDAAKALLPTQPTQVFAYRFSTRHTLRLQADNILPELSVSQILACHLGETETTLEAELELDVREAPLRELLLRIPKGYVVARLDAPGLGDYFVTDTPNPATAQLRLVYGQPVLGRAPVLLRLEQDRPPASTNSWTLPRIEVTGTRSVRGHVAVSADAGFRLTPATTTGLTEIATAFFPKKIAGLQAAFRLSDPAWQATLTVERLPQSIQTDVFHLFSVGEGIAYGSSIIHYVIAGAPIAAFRIALTNEYFNVEFTGKDVRNWQKTADGYLVQLHAPVAGAYTLLATYERPFKAQGETLRFNGAQPLDAQSEQGHTIAVSTYQFQVQPANVSAGLIALEPGEVPAEYRLFFDAPILAAYRYNARPFDLQLALKPLTQGESVNQVVDRAALSTRISNEGQVVTDARYFVKSRGTPHLRLTLPPGAELWSVTVNGDRVVPVAAGGGHLVPLPQKADPNAVNDLEIKVGTPARNATRLSLAAPILGAPVLLSEWTVAAESGRRLVFRRGSLTPADGTPDLSGFAALARHWRAGPFPRTWGALGSLIGLLLVVTWTWRLAVADPVRRWDPRHLLGGLLAATGCLLIAAILLQFALGAESVPPSADAAASLRFIAPIQQAGSSLSIDVAHLPQSSTVETWIGHLWPALVAAAFSLAGAFSPSGGRRRLMFLAAWLLVFWGALRAPNGVAFLIVLLIGLLVARLVIPAARRWWNVPPRSAPPSSPDNLPATATLLLLLTAFGAPAAHAAAAAAKPSAAPENPAPTTVAESVVHQVRVRDDFVHGTATVRWQATRGQILPLLHSPGVLTGIRVANDAVRPVQITVDGRTHQALLAERAGNVDLSFDYQLAVSTRDSQRGFHLPVQFGLVNRMDLTLEGFDADLDAPGAVSQLRRGPEGSTNASFHLVLVPAHDSWIGWRPRSRDTRREKAVFYAELAHLYVPASGVIEGFHHLQVRPAQGELNELTVDVPSGLTITDVVAPLVSLWRFDPAAGRLRIGLSPVQSRPFALLIRSQTATGPLPLQQSTGLPAVRNAAGQVGLIGVATGSEIQLNDARGDGLTAINIEDFPAAVVGTAGASTSGLALRRAFRYATPTGSLHLAASAVEPDVRVEGQQTVSLGEDRTTLAANLSVTITRAGIFKLGFTLPPGFDVESASSPAMSHWTELKTEAGRVVTLHLKTRTEGTHSFALSLTGPGARAVRGWDVPRLTLHEAAKQRGQLLIVPEQGMRLVITARDAVTQIDPAQAGIRQKGVLAFRLLQADWKLTLDLERVDAWTQVTSLQQIDLNEALIRVSGLLQYEIENAGLKSLHVRLPAAAESVRFRGDQVSDFLPTPTPTNGTARDWEIKLHRRVSGNFTLQVSYSQPLAPQATNALVPGIEAREVNLQRGFVTVHSGSRLQARLDTPPAALQPAEWQSIPRSLLRESRATAPDHVFRLVEPAFQMDLRLERHEATRLLPAHVNSLTLSSVISDDGAVLTQARLVLIPGDKQALRLNLPNEARFWFAFVAENSVLPWRENDQILIPLEQHSRTREPITVDFLFSGSAGRGPDGNLDLSLPGPRFDLPLENITWQIYLNEKWKLDHWTGTLQLLDQTRIVPATALGIDAYIQREAGAQKAKTREAEQFLSTANALLQKGDPEQARRAFQNAYGLSQHDNAFNEDARVQLHNLKTQQAIVGLNVRQARVAGEGVALENAPRNLRDGLAPAYTQEEAQRLMQRNTAEENSVQMRLAERVIQQQEAVAARPSAIRATLPEQGRRLVFARSLQVETNADLQLKLKASAAREISTAAKVGILALALLVAALISWLGRDIGQTPPAPTPNR